MSEAELIIADKTFLSKGLSLPHSMEACPGGIVIPVDKPFRWTSADVIRKLKWAAIHWFGKKNLKVGHAGTLDPLATGVLIVCIGNATKLAEEFQRHDKEYVAGISFGATTPSYDLEKDIDRRYPLDGVSEEALRAVLPSFLGEQEQVAPLFSAKSVDGVRAYELARKAFKAYKDGAEDFDHSAVESLSRQKINISGLELMAWSADGVRSVPDPSDCGKPNPRINLVDTSALHLPLATLRIACSKGTYVRAFARDLGEALGSGAHLNSLQRSRSGIFPVESALSMDEAMALLSGEL